ncbi:uncharacterized protein LOC135162062 [Diachasmimorpha longicaudata]|uniref:uncharacterized protein LOC135162062 n=1 Tax=Diachasmimorpha longicaudata TaxID=58733 RepID=UPI0030B8A26D
MYSTPRPPPDATRRRSPLGFGQRGDLNDSLIDLDDNIECVNQPDSSTHVANVEAPRGYRFKLPVFSKSQPQLWFYQADSVFEAYRVTGDVDKFHLVVSHLSPDVLQEIPDILENPPATDKYKYLKQELLKRITDSPDRQLEKALSEVQLGSQKPSQLLRQLQLLAGNRATEDTLRVKWLSLLPADVRRILKITKTLPLKDLAVAADDLLEESSRTTVMAVSSHARPPVQQHTSSVASELTELRLAMTQLITLNQSMAKSIERLGHAVNRGRSRSRHPSTSRPNSPAPGGMCMYHARFGDEARKCHKPCNFVSSTYGQLSSRGN